MPAHCLPLGRVPACQQSIPPPRPPSLTPCIPTTSCQHQERPPRLLTLLPRSRPLLYEPTDGIYPLAGRGIRGIVPALPLVLSTSHLVLRALSTAPAVFPSHPALQSQQGENGCHESQLSALCCGQGIIFTLQSKGNSWYAGRGGVCEHLGDKAPRQSTYCLSPLSLISQPALLCCKGDKDL